MQSGKWLRYKRGEVRHPDGVITLLFGRVLIETAYTRQYHNALRRLAVLSPCARNLIDYLAQVMTSDGVVFSNAAVRRAFRGVMQGFGVVYGDSTVVRAFGELQDGGLLVGCRRGVYRVNPEYFAKNKAAGRETMIKRQYENDKDE